MIPFESHNLFYRDERATTLAALRAELDGFIDKRKAAPTPQTAGGQESATIVLRELGRRRQEN